MCVVCTCTVISFNVYLGCVLVYVCMRCWWACACIRGCIHVCFHISVECYTFISPRGPEENTIIVVKELSLGLHVHTRSRYYSLRSAYPTSMHQLPAFQVTNI